MEDLGEGAHIAVLYGDPADRDQYLIPYLSAALRAGDGGVCVTSADQEELTREVRLDAPESTGEIQVVSSAGSYLKDGKFARKSMTSWLSSLAAEAPAGSEAPRLRIAGDLDWVQVLDGPGLRELFTYEATLDAFAPGCRHTFACFYDARRLPARNVIDVFRTHHRVLVGGALWDSPFYTAAPIPRGPGTG